MAILFASATDDPTPWREGFAAELPGLDFRVWPARGNAADIDCALVWQPPAGALRDLPNLEILYALGAGVEHVLADPDLPRGVPLVRLVDPGLTAGMTEFVVMRVLHYHRRMPEYEAAQREKSWRPLPQKLPQDRRVGILGLGVLGRAAATALLGLGLDVAGWSRTPKSIDGVKSLCGEDGLFALLERSEILVCLLPLTRETEGVLDATALGALPDGACVINAARGGHVVDADLLAALDSGRVAAATLDVFTQEPLPPEHPYWTHPKVTVVPHAAAYAQPKTGVKTIADNLRRHRAGQRLRDVVDVKQGY